MWKALPRNSLFHSERLSVEGGSLQPLSMLPSESCQQPTVQLLLWFWSLCFPQCSCNMACHMNLVGRSFPERQMEITSIPTCTLISPSPTDAHINLLLLRAAITFRSHFPLVWLEHQCFPLQRGPFSLILLAEDPFVWSMPCGSGSRTMPALGALCGICSVLFYGSDD